MRAIPPPFSVHRNDREMTDMQPIIKMLLLIALDAVLIGVLALALSPLMVFKRAAFAVLKRNFIGYFSNPTGYVFLCMFVLFTSIAAFVPPEFFAANLANLDQLNNWLPWIMLLYVPTITMSIWSEERRQGTDELLLTLPADDFDIVMGKYLAAAGVFTASLLFSQLSNFAVLVSLALGDIDIGLLFTTYLGYWLIGLAMLAVGMIASFLTSNLTVGFILGLLFNAPLVALSRIDWLLASDAWVERIRQLSLSEAFDDFGRGVISVAGLIYFLLIIVVGIYLSMVLVGRRHWYGGRDGESLLGHYVVRAVSLIVVALCANVVLAYYDPVRIDTTKGQVSSLSSASKRLIRNLETKSPVKIDAYIGSNLPDEYIKTRHDLVSMLKELERIGGKRMQVRIFENVDPYGEVAAQAEQRYGIKPQRISTVRRGSFKDEQVMLGVAFTCGLEKVVLPFIDYGVPIEYELTRSIATAARGERYTIGVVRTDAQMMGGITMAGMQPRSINKRAIVTELEQQYKVEEVDPSQPIDVEKYDALLVVQPSSLAPTQLPNVIDAIEKGEPTAIFEDPLAVMSTWQGVPGTGMPKPPQGFMGMGGPPPEKCDITQLWEAIGVQVLGQRTGAMFEPDIVWQSYNPYPQIGFSYMGPEFVYVRDEIPYERGSIHGFSQEDAVTKGLEEVLFPFPGGVKRISGTGLEFEKLAVTNGDISGNYPFNKWMENRMDLQQLSEERGSPSGEKVIAARITGKRKDAVQKMADDADEKKSDEGDNKEADKKDEASKGEKKDTKPDGIHVVYVADIDMLGDEFLGLRARPDSNFDFRFDNVTFALNLLDSLVGDDRFIEIRSRKLRYSTLKQVEQRVSDIRKREEERNQQFLKEFEDAVKRAKEASEQQYKYLEDRQKDLQAKQAAGEPITIDELQQVMSDLAERRRAAEKKLEQENTRLQQRRDSDIEKTRRDFEQEIQGIQNQYKRWAVILPPIPPALVGLVVFARRRLREREGIARTRLR